MGSELFVHPALGASGLPGGGGAWPPINRVPGEERLPEGGARRFAGTAESPRTRMHTLGPGCSSWAARDKWWPRVGLRSLRARQGHQRGVGAGGRLTELPRLSAGAQGSVSPEGPIARSGPGRWRLQGRGCRGRRPACGWHSERPGVGCGHEHMADVAAGRKMPSAGPREPRPGSAPPT